MSEIACQPIHAVVLGGGNGLRLGRVSKSNLNLAGRRLIDVVIEGLAPSVTGRIIVVAPPEVVVPSWIGHTLEDPPDGGPLAGIGAGLELLNIDEGGAVLVCGVDMPASGITAPKLVGALNAHPDKDGAVMFGGEPEPFRQYLQGIYRLPKLANMLSSMSSLRDSDVWRVLERLDLVEVAQVGDECKDIDTPDDLEWWRDHLSEPHY